MLNPFGPNATLGSDQIPRRLSPGHSQGEDLDAPQSHAPLASSSFAPPLSAFSENLPNFALGFGLDIPEADETQEATDQPQVAKHAAGDTNPVDANDSEDEEFDDGELDGRDGSTTAPNSRYHSRHVSRLSGALSLLSVGGLTEDNVPLRSPIPVLDIDDLSFSRRMPCHPSHICAESDPYGSCSDFHPSGPSYRCQVGDYSGQGS